MEKSDFNGAAWFIGWCLMVAGVATLLAIIGIAIVDRLVETFA